MLYVRCAGAGAALLECQISHVAVAPQLKRCFITRPRLVTMAAALQAVGCGFRVAAL
jgi:hypothetical protein